MKRILVLAVGSILSLSATAQAGPGTIATMEPVVAAHGFQVTLISRNVMAVDYRQSGGATDVDFVGTALLPSADGKAKVRSKRGTLEVEAEFGNLQNPTTSEPSILPMFCGRSRPKAGQ